MEEPVNPIDDREAGQPVSRRGLFKYVLLAFSALATAGGVLTPIISYLWPPKQASAVGGGRVQIAATEDLPVGTGEVYSVNNKPVLVVHTADGYRALSAICTHLGCILFWNEQREVIACPCHEAYFSTNGAVISGPPTSALEEYRLVVEGGEIYVEGGEA
jgi:cytochrome b6-f complex iron-sulfur subunit